MPLLVSFAAQDTATRAPTGTRLFPFFSWVHRHEPHTSPPFDGTRRGHAFPVDDRAAGDDHLLLADSVQSVAAGEVQAALAGVDGVQQAAVIAGILIANAAALGGAWVSLRVAVAKLEVRVEGLKRDVDNLGNLYRGTKNQNEE